MKFVARTVSIVAVLASSAAFSTAQALTITTIPIGNSGNAADGTGGFGSVAYPFRMGMTEISNAQYVEFLNTVAGSDPYSLYKEAVSPSPFASPACPTCAGITRDGMPGGYRYAVKPPAVGQGPGGTDYSYENKPAVYVTRFDAMRFVNWLHNGQGSGDTESGAYTLLGGTPFPSNWDSITRSPGARWWLPSESEWYKAAYYNPDTGLYSSYPTRTSSLPNNHLPSGDTGNSANFGCELGTCTTGKSTYPMTDVGAYTLSPSYYGTFDQAGNAYEWDESIITSSAGKSAGRRGGSWDSFSFDLAKSNRTLVDVWNLWGGDAQTGFRVAAAAVPESSTFVLAVVGLSTCLARSRRHSLNNDH
jgi:formylglycine-generating enzyme required for sulfatase activity